MLNGNNLLRRIQLAIFNLELGKHLRWKPRKHYLGLKIKIRKKIKNWLVTNNIPHKIIKGDNGVVLIITDSNNAILFKIKWE